MTAERWEQVKLLFSAALIRPAAERPQFLRAACPIDPEICAEVERVVAEYERAGSFLEKPAVNLPADSSPEPSFTPGEVISSRYSIVRFMARGGMGEVYEAKDLELGGVVALKTLLANAALSPATLGRFKREVLARKVNDRHVCQTYDFGWHRRLDGTGIPYLTMEFLAGETLADKLRRDGPLSPIEALALVRQMAQALAAAHRIGIIHRDFKSSNVIIVKEGHASIAKVTDFGLARGVADEESCDLTAPGHAVGTPAYMAPEQFRGEASIASDIYAFGVVIHEMITGSRPFRPAHSAQASISLVRIRAPELGPPWDTVIAKCLHSEPSKRFARVEDVTAALLSDEQHPTVTLSGQRLRAAKKLKVGWVAAVIALLATLIIAAALIRVFRPWGPPPIRERRIAVLPFTDLDKSGVNQAFCDGLTEMLVSQLTQLEQFQTSLLVIPSTEIRKDKISSARDAQRTFGVNLVLTGTVQRSSTGIRLIANLIDARETRQIGSRIITIPEKDIALMEDAVINQIAGMLDLSVRSQARALLARGQTENPGAYDFYLQGYGYLRRYGPMEDADHAIEEFDHALSLDPSFALAYAGLGEAYWRKYVLTKDRKWVELAWRQCEHALKLNEQLAPVHATLGLLHAGTGKYAEAEQEYKRALQIDPVNNDAFVGLASAYQATGHYDDAETTYKRAIRVRPGYWNGYARLGKFYSMRGRYSDAVEPFRRVTELIPDNPTAYANLGGVYLYLGRDEEAEREFKKSIAIKPTPGAYSNLATVYLLEHRFKQAVQILETIVTPDCKDYRLWGNLGDAYRWASGPSDKSARAYAEAIRLIRSSLVVNPKNATALAALATFLAKSANAAEAVARADQAVQLAPTDIEILFDAALGYELSGKRQQAIDALARAVQGGYSRNNIAKDVDLKNLRADPAAVAILGK